MSPALASHDLQTHCHMSLPFLAWHEPGGGQGPIGHKSWKPT